MQCTRNITKHGCARSLRHVKCKSNYVLLGICNSLSWKNGRMPKEKRFQSHSVEMQCNAFQVSGKSRKVKLCVFFLVVVLFSPRTSQWQSKGTHSDSFLGGSGSNTMCSNSQSFKLFMLWDKHISTGRINQLLTHLKFEKKLRSFRPQGLLSLALPDKTARLWVPALLRETLSSLLPLYPITPATFDHLL